MFRKGLIACLLAVSAVSARVVVRLAPLRPLVEAVVPAPGVGYVWTPGYYGWSGQAYVWSPGAWVVVPWPGAPLGTATLDPPDRRLGFCRGVLALREVAKREQREYSHSLSIDRHGSSNGLTAAFQLQKSLTPLAPHKEQEAVAATGRSHGTATAPIHGRKDIKL